MKKKLSKKDKEQRIIGASYALNRFREHIIEHHFQTSSLTVDSILAGLKHDIDKYKKLMNEL